MHIPSSNQPNNRADEDFLNIEPMSHQEALRDNAAELYVLRDLTPAQEASFEAHYFECQECAQAVAILQTLPPPKPAPHPASPIIPLPQPALPWWRSYALMAAAALLGLFTAFQNFITIPSLKTQLADLSAPQPNTEITAHLIQAGAESGDLVATPFFTVGLPLDSNDYPKYQVTVSPSGQPPISEIFPKPPNDRLSLHLTRQAFPPGSYDVSVCGLKQDSKTCSQTWQYHFTTKKGN